MKKKDTKSRVDQLLNMAYTTTSIARTAAIARQILEISPDNTEALVMLADTTEDANTRTSILSRALSSLNDPDKCPPEDRDILTFTINYRLAYTYFMDNLPEKSLSCCEEALRVSSLADDSEAAESEDDMRSLYYRVLIELKAWGRILADTLKDDNHTLSWGYSRLVAAWMSAPGENRNVCANMFWDVLMIAPEVPFYMLGYLPEPDDDADDEEQEEFRFSLMYYDVLSVSDDFYNWFTRGTVLFGLLTNRFDGREREYMLDVLDTLGGYEEFERMSGILIEADDMSVIETLAANKCLSE